MMRRLTVGGFILVGLGIVIGSLTGLPGLGGRGNEGSHDPATQDSNPQPVDSQSQPQSIDKPAEESADVIDVLIGGQTYFFRPAGAEKYRPIELSELIRLAKQARGNHDGIRVRIARRKTSRASAEQQLEDELTKAGLPRNSLSWQKDLVD